MYSVLCCKIVIMNKIANAVLNTVILYKLTQYASALVCKLTISAHLFARRHLFRHVGYLRHQQQVDPLTLKLVSESQCDVGYLCAYFSLPRRLFSS